jgi:hypothetical protein
MGNLYIGPSIDTSYQVSVHLAVTEEKILKNKKFGKSETRIACDGHVC